MLKLIIHNWHSAESFCANTFPLLRIFDCDVKSSASSSHAEGSDTDSSREESLSDLEESRADVLCLRHEVSALVNIVVLVEHIDARNPNIIKLEDGIVDPIDAKLDSHITDGHSWESFAGD